MSEEQPIPAPASPAILSLDSEVWAVVGQEGSEKRTEGFLVTTRDRLPKPIAFITRADAAGLLSAHLIASGKISPEMEIDLRGRADAAARFAGKLLVPISIKNPQPSDIVAATFIDSGGGKISFVVYIKGGFEAALQRAKEKYLGPQPERNS
jgi:hypothetical protein